MRLSETFKPEPNQEYTLQLKYNQGRNVSGAWGPQLLWFLADGRKLFTPPYFQKLIDEQGIKAGEKFTLVKSTKGRKTEWAVTRVKTPQAVVSLLDGVGPLDSPVPEPEHDDDPPPIPLTRLEHALKTAVHAAHKAELHGIEIGYNIRFTPADIRAMAISVLIQGERRAA